MFVVEAPETVEVTGSRLGSTRWRRGRCWRRSCPPSTWAPCRVMTGSWCCEPTSAWCRITKPTSTVTWPPWLTPSKADFPDDVELAYRAAAAEIRVALRLTRRAADSALDLAQDLKTRLPRLFDALLSGDVDMRRAKTIVYGTTHLPVDTARKVVDQVIERAPGLTTGQLGARIRTLCIESDPDEAEDRYQHAVQDRRVVASMTEAATANLAAYDLPPDRVAAAMARIHHLAQSLNTRHESRTMDQLRADVFLDLLDGVHVGHRRTQNRWRRGDTGRSRHPHRSQERSRGVGRVRTGHRRHRPPNRHPTDVYAVAVHGHRPQHRTTRRLGPHPQTSHQSPLARNRGSPADLYFAGMSDARHRIRSRSPHRIRQRRPHHRSQSRTPLPPPSLDPPRRRMDLETTPRRRSPTHHQTRPPIHDQRPPAQTTPTSLNEERRSRSSTNPKSPSRPTPAHSVGRANHRRCGNRNASIPRLLTWSRISFAVVIAAAGRASSGVASPSHPRKEGRGHAQTACAQLLRLHRRLRRRPQPGTRASSRHRGDGTPRMGLANPHLLTHARAGRRRNRRR